MPAYAARGVNPYLQAEVQSRTPLELVVMLYDGALRFCTEARDAITQKDVARRGRAISRAMAIVSELHCTLDMEAGGDVAQSLDKLYSFVRDRLMDASIRQDVRSIDEAARVLTTLREGWVGISTAAK
jgi:flagellar secretion chaperone FliS